MGQFSNELRNILRNQTFCSCFMLRAPLMKIDKAEATQLFFLMLFVVVMALVYLLILPGSDKISLNHA